MTDDLRQRIDDAIRPVMLLGLQDAELHNTAGAERIGEWVDWISKTVAELVQPEPRQPEPIDVLRCGCRGTQGCTCPYPIEEDQ
ncbi:hypothetical protein [Streptomyces nigrescens]|uniref:Uncharacterized protein n=1 Tax=Streptomyces nigrescens TaxID=1920 RepID=A0A640TC87_STRNI|nr:hypothetical protein [Streptomyces libani]WAT94942.1 hypothetical protein STRLI_000614 [Streptomyces libani subsp. libani]GFE20091.1 hypothetical protein Sliba_05440 [Streptomyces libani subsp. libani]GGV85837.1 hypothetical protein GCM10010500_02970 [Streptomyces libani subsp. libani]